MARGITGWGGTLSLGGATVAVRNVQITRQASEVDITAHGDTKQYAIAGRVKRGGSFEAYVGGGTSNVANLIESPNYATPASLTFTDGGGTATTMNVIITGADQTHASDSAATYQVTFVETMALA